MIRARRGTGHSPADPAHMIRSPRTSVTAFGMTPRPVPSHKLAWIIAIDGSGAGASWSLGALRAQALRTSVEMSIEEPTAETRFIPALLALVGDAARGVVGGVAHLDLLQVAGKECV